MGLERDNVNGLGVSHSSGLITIGLDRTTKDGLLAWMIVNAGAGIVVAEVVVGGGVVVGAAVSAGAEQLPILAPLLKNWPKRLTEITIV